MKEQLKSIGLTENEAKVYLALVNNGPFPAGKITEKSGIHRRSVYDAIDRLIKKGMVGYIKKNNVKVYEAANPQNLLDIMRKKEEDIKEIIPELEKIYSATKEKKETLFFRGKEGVKSIFLDQIREGKEILILGASPQAYDILKYYLPHYDKERKIKGIKAKIIFDHTARKEKSKISLSEIKYLLGGVSGPTATNIYGDNVALMIWTENPYAILIKDKDVADSYRTHFEFMWGLAKK
jgi:HTH-type transcriptional regulator, sugar sensing transcriptional regulator